MIRKIPKPQIPVSMNMSIFVNLQKNSSPQKYTNPPKKINFIFIFMAINNIFWQLEKCIFTNLVCLQNKYTTTKNSN